jgi:hypothetical protein
MKIEVGDLVCSIYKKSGKAPGAITHEYDEGRSLGIVLEVEEVLANESEKQPNFTHRCKVEWLSNNKGVEMFANHFLKKVQ